ncbi:MAG: C40 family peptidase [Candidatus Uhrbacteria bacterium]|nr:C40 family peptidase [Candidatus Uhrbacteria bacterium]
MEYRAVQNRSTFILDDLQLPISHEEAIRILKEKGFVFLDIDIVKLARSCIKTSRYRRGAKPSEAPAVVDCSSFIKWLYGECGIWLPRRSIQQRAYGEHIDLHALMPGDIIFTSGHIDYYDHDPTDGVGHVGIYTKNQTVIHAANKKEHVIETELARFIKGNAFRGARRYIPQNKEVRTVQAPKEREIEIANDLRWIILQSL